MKSPEQTTDIAYVDGWQAAGHEWQKWLDANIPGWDDMNVDLSTLPSLPEACDPILVAWAERAAQVQRAIEARGPMEDTILSIPIRDGGVAVRIQGLPHDLTPREAQKIAAVVMTYAQTTNAP